MRSVSAGVILALLAACGGGDAESETAETEPAPPAHGVYGTAPAARQGVPSFVSLQPEPPAPGDPVQDEKTIDQFGLAFSPTAIMLRPGGTVRFTNSEAALVHNVEIRSLEGDSILISDDTASGETLDVVFDEAGGYDVSCDHHPGMTAFIFVTPDWYGGPAETDGSFAFDVPAGQYTLSVWSLDPALRSERTVSVGDEATRVTIPDG